MTAQTQQTTSSRVTLNGLLQKLPKTGQYVGTSGQCFNAATTEVIRVEPRRKPAND